MAHLTSNDLRWGDCLHVEDQASRLTGVVARAPSATTTITDRYPLALPVNVRQYVRMAKIREFFKTNNSAKPHPTEVECGYQKVHTPSGTLLQLSTYGSDARQSEKKVSQTLQLDERGAAELLGIIKQTFPALS